MLNYYHILGVPIGSSTEIIKRAYREQIKFFHPDVFQGNPEVAYQKTLILNEAYTVLSNPDKRNVYDAQLLDAIRRSNKSDSGTQKKEGGDHVNTNQEYQESPPESQSQSSNSKNTEQQKNGSSSSSHLKKQPYIFTAVLILFCFIAYFAYNQGYAAAKKQFEKTDEINSLESENKWLKTRINLLNNQLTETQSSLDGAELRLSFWDNHAVIVTEYGTKYHKFYCYHLENMDYFYIYNTELAESLGYTACKDCHPSTLTITKR